MLGHIIDVHQSAAQAVGHLQARGAVRGDVRPHHPSQSQVRELSSIMPAAAGDPWPVDVTSTSQYSQREGAPSALATLFLQYIFFTLKDQARPHLEGAPLTVSFGSDLIGPYEPMVEGVGRYIVRGPGQHLVLARLTGITERSGQGR